MNNLPLFSTRQLLTLLLCSVPFCATAKVKDLLPKPHKVEIAEGEKPFALGRAVVLNDETGNASLLRFLNETHCTTSAEATARISVELVSEIPDTYDYELAAFPNESYTLTVSANDIKICAVTSTGVTRAAQTLM